VAFTTADVELVYTRRLTLPLLLIASMTFLRAGEPALVGVLAAIAASVGLCSFAGRVAQHRGDVEDADAAGERRVETSGHE